MPKQDCLMPIDQPQLKVGAHVLVQLGRELVTDAEQAILECVKNAYDADSPGCLIDIDTKEQAVRVEIAPANRLLDFDKPFETVAVSFIDGNGEPLESSSNELGEEPIKRLLSYQGRLTIEDNGDGLTPEQLQSSWLVVSQSAKRTETGQRKVKTSEGRTPLGDKGLGRLGSMKLGDILLIETATAPSLPIASAQFRWTDCETAQTVDQIPVYLTSEPNTQKFKGTRVSVLGLRDLEDWKRKGRIFEIARSLAKLISPFEATSTFPVKITLNDDEQSLVAITDDVLKQAIASFSFEWRTNEASGKSELVAEARFRKRLFTTTRSRKHEDRTRAVFGKDNGAAFAAYLPGYRRLRGYEEREISLDGSWFIELKQTFKWDELVSSDGVAAEDPGPFNGAFYFFHFDNIDDDNEGAAAGIGVNKELIKSMSGISILRDGFRVRSPGDWLDISASMTSGSTYNMRVDNTVGYFSLSGESNFKLVEKSDREGFVEDAAYRGFFAIARACRKFANDSLENVRRALDDYAREIVVAELDEVTRTSAGSIQFVEDNLRSAREARDAAGDVAARLKAEMDEIKGGDASGSRATERALKIATSAIKAMESVSAKLTNGRAAELDFMRLKQELDDRNERAIALLESAAVGLSARGLAHELRTHLTEIRQRTTALEKSTQKKDFDRVSVLAGLRAIRGSCNAIISAASLIDPMLPRTRSLKEEIDLRTLFESYIKTREITLERAGIATVIRGASRTVRANRSRLIQVVDNLVRNSVYWLRQSELKGSLKKGKQVFIDFTKSGFVLSDNGPGVDTKYEDTLFDMFVTAKPQREGGQGLGLFITERLLEVDGCDIELLADRNEAGRRFRFAVNLKPILKA
jgi:signal transduction histidine kinase